VVDTVGHVLVKTGTCSTTHVRHRVEHFVQLTIGDVVGEQRVRNLDGGRSTSPHEWAIDADRRERHDTTTGCHPAKHIGALVDIVDEDVECENKARVVSPINAGTDRFATQDEFERIVLSERSPRDTVGPRVEHVGDLLDEFRFVHSFSAVSDSAAMCSASVMRSDATFRHSATSRVSRSERRTSARSD